MDTWIRSALVIVIAVVVPGAGLGQEGPRFADFGVTDVYHGPIASPTFSRIDDERYRRILEDSMKLGPTFAARYVLVQFQIGSGPVGAVIVDVKSGSVFHLPRQVVREDFFIYDTECLALKKKWRI